MVPVHVKYSEGLWLSRRCMGHKRRRQSWSHPFIHLVIRWIFHIRVGEGQKNEHFRIFLSYEHLSMGGVLIFFYVHSLRMLGPCSWKSLTLRAVTALNYSRVKKSGAWNGGLFPMWVILLRALHHPDTWYSSLQKAEPPWPSPMPQHCRGIVMR